MAETAQPSSYETAPEGLVPRAPSETHVQIPAIVFLILGFGLMVLPIPGLSHLIQYRFGATPADARAIQAILQKLVVLVFVLSVVLYWERKPLRSIGVNIPRFSEVGLGFAIFIATELAALIMTLALLAIGVMGGTGSHFRPMARMLAMPIGLGLIVALVNGIVEELLARGYAIERLKTLTGSTMVAVVAALMADLAIHVPFWGLRYAVAIAPLQIVFVLAYLWRRDLTACVVGHILNDAFPFLLVAAMPAFAALTGHMSYELAAGQSCYYRSDYPDAVSHLSAAINRNPPNKEALDLRAYSYWYMDDYAHARADFERVLKLSPDDAKSANDFAWLLSTWPNASARDGRRAVELAQRAGKLTAWKRPAILDTLAAAYAEIGDFRNAVKWQQAALDFERPDLRHSTRHQMEARLELYRKQTPYHCGCENSAGIQLGGESK